MLLTDRKIRAALLAAGLAAASGLVYTHRILAQRPQPTPQAQPGNPKPGGIRGESARDLAAWVEQRVRAWQPTSQERRLDQIGWAKSLREAERLARQHGRPVFLFTYSGVDLATHRC